jgi:hypothetical protein
LPSFGRIIFALVFISGCSLLHVGDFHESSTIDVERSPKLMDQQAGRRLKATSYFDGIATSGVCEICGRLFEANVDSSSNIFQAIRKFLLEFEVHDCQPVSSFTTLSRPDPS